MKFLVKPRHIYKYFYSTSNDKRTVKARQEEPEPYNLLSDQEIEYEVRIYILFKVHKDHKMLSF